MKRFGGHAAQAVAIGFGVGCVSAWRGSELFQSTGQREFSTTPVRHEVSSRRLRFRKTQFKGDVDNPLYKPWKPDPNVLYIVPVPIGNVKDFTLRALEIVKECDYIISSNRSATRFLMDTIDVDVQGRIVHYHPNEGEPKLLEMMKGGSSMCFLTAAGTPCVGDAGSHLLRFMASKGVRVSSLPGACSITTALSMAPVRTPGDGRFYFAGWIPAGFNERIRQIKEAVTRDCPTIFFESPKRLLTVLECIAAIDLSARVALVHEMTKLHESVHYDEVRKLIGYYQSSKNADLIRKGECVVIVEGAPVEDAVLKQADHVIVEPKFSDEPAQRSGTPAIDARPDLDELEAMNLLQRPLSKTVDVAQAEQLPQSNAEKFATAFDQDVLERVQDLLQRDPSASEMTVLRLVSQDLLTSKTNIAASLQKAGGLGKVRSDLFGYTPNLDEEDDDINLRRRIGGSKKRKPLRRKPGTGRRVSSAANEEEKRRLQAQVEQQKAKITINALKDLAKMANLSTKAR